jgi:hypothetical protein
MSAARSTRVIATAVLMACATALAACSSGSSAPVATHPAGVPYFSRTGTGTATLPQIALPSRWTLLWHFDCTDPASRRRFVLTSTPSSGTTTKVTDQTGLEGGGYRPFATAGDYTFAVTTTCSWHVLVGTAGMQTMPATTSG